MMRAMTINRRRKEKWLALLLAAGWLGALAAQSARIEASGAAAPDFISVQSTPDVRQGYVLREDTWNGDLSVGERKAIAHQLTKGNDYRFYLGADVKGAKLSVHVYDQDGNLAESSSWQRAEGDACMAGASVRPGRTGTYYLIVKIEQSPEASTPWGMAYAYK